MLRLPAAFVTALAVPALATRLPSGDPNSAATIRPLPRMSLMGNFFDSSTRPYNSVALTRVKG